MKQELEKNVVMKIGINFSSRNSVNIIDVAVYRAGLLMNVDAYKSRKAINKAKETLNHAIKKNRFFGKGRVINSVINYLDKEHVKRYGR